MISIILKMSFIYQRRRSGLQIWRSGLRASGISRSLASIIEFKIVGTLPTSYGMSAYCLDLLEMLLDA